jgi:putative transcriptional regulator
VSPLKGKLLLATPPLVDPNFDRTVVLMLEHGDEGALGLVLNRPTDEDVDELLPNWRPLITGAPVLFDGGPVEQAAVIGLAWVRAEPLDAAIDGADVSDWVDGDDNAEEGLGTVDLSEDPDAVIDRLEQLRLFRGYAGWGPGQLEDELAANAWIVVDADRSDAFTGAPQSLWRDVLRRQGGSLARMGDRIPDDVSEN